MTPKLAVIQFPGSNCEYETAYACSLAGFETSIVRWNEEVKFLDLFDAYVLPGGFSYQDRVRSGEIAAKLPIMSVLAKAADEGKPILGICNGCQILAAARLIPHLALAPNRKENEAVGFICDWVFVKIQNPEKSVFTRYFSQTEVLPIPINHGEGRFILSPEAASEWPNLAAIRYCSEKGAIDPYFPHNPNGSEYNLAGLCNARGNVLAIMPHPERASLLKQMPTWIDSDWAETKKNKLATSEPTHPGPWHPLFLSAYKGCLE